MSHEEIIAETRRWLERAVIGLDLCPFAQSVHRAGRVRFVVSDQRNAAGLVEDLRSELLRLHREDPLECETTLLIHPWALNDFLEYNEFLAVCDEAVLDLGLEGELQVASFHPHYQFEGSASGDVENYTNRSPYPTLHALREASIEQALAGFSNPDIIYENNILRLRSLGIEGWKRLWVD